MLIKSTLTTVLTVKKPFQQLKLHLNAKHLVDIEVQEMLKGTSKEKSSKYKAMMYKEQLRNNIEKGVPEKGIRSDYNADQIVSCKGCWKTMKLSSYRQHLKICFILRNCS